MPTHLSKALLAGLLAVSLSGCMSSGVKVDESKVAEFKRGETTYPDVLKVLGRPTQSTFMPDGSHMIMYSYMSAQARPESFIPIVGAFVGGADSENSTVMLTFDENGVLKNTMSSQGGTGVGTGLEGYSQDRKDVRQVQ